MKPAYLSEADIELRADQILLDYERQTGRQLVLPVPIERVIDQVLDIPIEWQPIPVSADRVIVSKLIQPSLGVPSRIVLNENLLSRHFRDYPGLEQTALGHEAGHAVFHLEAGRIQQLRLDLTIGDESANFTSEADSLTTGLAAALAMRGPDGDDWWREWQAHTFMRFVLMPRRLLVPLLVDYHLGRWSELYRLRGQCEVTISALVVHLTRLGYIRVDQQRVIHEQTARGRGQQDLLT